MKIDIRSKESVYIEINGFTYYIDDSSNEQYMNKWITGAEDGVVEISNDKVKIKSMSRERVEWLKKNHKLHLCPEYVALKKHLETKKGI
tara:strand:- start:392 stop:658 length:267 start_codon:yes stop_codon:yes gene_type:complete